MTLDHTFAPADTLRGTDECRTNHHDFQLLPDGHALFIVDEEKPVDMSALVPGGFPDDDVNLTHLRTTTFDVGFVQTIYSINHRT